MLDPDRTAGQGVRTSIGLGNGETVIVYAALADTVKMVERASQSGAFIKVTDVRRADVLWVNPRAVKVLQDADLTAGQGERRLHFFHAWNWIGPWSWPDKAEVGRVCMICGKRERVPREVARRHRVCD